MNCNKANLLLTQKKEVDFINQNETKKVDDLFNHITDLIGYKFNNKDLMISAFITGPYFQVFEKNKVVQNQKMCGYQRQEFLGDSLFAFLAREIIFDMVSCFDESSLTCYSQFLCSNQSLAKMFDQMSFDKVTFIPSHERISTKIKADIIEALIAAIYIDSEKDIRVLNKIVKFMYQYSFGDHVFDENKIQTLTLKYKGLSIPCQEMMTKPINKTKIIPKEKNQIENLKIAEVKTEVINVVESSKVEEKNVIDDNKKTIVSKTKTNSSKKTKKVEKKQETKTDKQEEFVFDLTFGLLDKVSDKVNIIKNNIPKMYVNHKEKSVIFKSKEFVFIFKSTKSKSGSQNRYRSP